MPVSVAAPVKVHLDVLGRASAAQRAKLNSAAVLLERALNTPAFERALTDRFGEARGESIYRRVISGAEVLTPRADGVADLKVGFFDQRRAPIARSSPNRALIEINRSGFDARDDASVARTLGHMLAYKLGLGGEVPSVMGRAAEKLSRPVAPPTRNPADYISAFRQGKEGNCVSIAAIKAAMARFGPDNIFSRLDRTSGGYSVVMRDGYSLRVTDAELKTAMGVSRMKGNDAGLLQRANVLYAAMAKRAQLEGNDGRRNMTYARACESLNDGESYKEGVQWLGLGKYVKKIAPGDMQKYTAVVAASARHAVFATGKVVDHYGSARPSSRGGVSVEGWGRRIVGAYALV